MNGVLFIQADSRLLNPTLDQALIDAAYADDPESARSEYGGNFRSDISSYLGDDVIDAAVCRGIKSRPRQLGCQHVAFVDPAGGVEGGDSMTLAVCHQAQGGRLLVDKLVAVDPPFQTETVVADFALVLSSYGLDKVRGDRYGGLWPAQAFQRQGIAYMQSEADKSAIYHETGPLFVNGLVELVDDARLVNELRLLERKPRAGGRHDAVDHPPGRASHDDRINAVCGALLQASKLPWTGRIDDGHSRGQHISGLAYDPIERDLERSRAVAAIPTQDGWGRAI
jgi:hypothetical protein